MWLLPLPPNQDRQAGYCHPTGRWSVAFYARGATNYSGARFAPPHPRARAHRTPQYPRTLTTRFQAIQLPSPSHHFTTSPSQSPPHHLTIAPPHNLPTSPSPHLTISPPHHLTSSLPHNLPTSPSPHLPTSPPPHFTTSPPHDLTISRAPHFRRARPALHARHDQIPPRIPMCTGDRNGPLTLFLPEFSARRGGARAIVYCPPGLGGRFGSAGGRLGRVGARRRSKKRVHGPLDHTQGPRHVSLIFGSSRVGRGVSKFLKLSFWRA